MSALRSPEVHQLQGCDEKIPDEKIPEEEREEAMLFYTKSEACEMLKISPRTLERIMRNGDLAFYRIGGSIRINDDDLEAFIRRQRTQNVPVSRPCTKTRTRRGQKAGKPDSMQYVPGMKVVG